MPISAISPDGLRPVGFGLQRPEDVVVGRDGRVWASDQASACAELLAEGGLRRVGKAGGAPNGITIDRQGRIIIANFGVYCGEPGPLQRLDPESGAIEILCEEIDGRPLTACNYPIVDRAGNIWCSHSTFAPSHRDAFDGRDDGILFRVAPDGRAEVMAGGLRFANGLALDADESHIYVCETTACDVVRFPIRSDGTLGPRERYGPPLGESLPPGAALDDLPAAARSRLGFTDGCGFDAEGNLWVTLPESNSVVAITPDGAVETIVADPAGTLIGHPANVSWGGPDLRDLYIGLLRRDYVLHARSPVPGLPLAHQRESG